MNINNKSYKIEFSSFENLKNKIINKVSSKDILIIDNKLKKNQVIKKIPKKYQKRCIFIKAEEKIKSLEKYSLIVESILKKGIQRDSKLISFGGGTIGDLSGFIASSLLRGIDHIIVPSSLLAMVDSSIGGKTGINSSSGKNLIGSFYLPKKVIICPEFLNTLPKRELNCGFAEIIKYSFINPNNLNKKLIKYDFKNKKDLQSIIKHSIITKIKYTRDFKEKLNSRSARSILNFGHTIGHAIENTNSYNSSIKHGEAVALGMLIEIKISKILGFYSGSIDNMISLFKKYNLPLNYNKFLLSKSFSKIIAKIKFDKKAKNDFINFICIDKKGGFVKKLSFAKLESLIKKID